MKTSTPELSVGIVDLLLFSRYWIGRSTKLVAIVWLTLLSLVCVTVHWAAEYNLFTAFVAYLPPWIALLPFAVLMLAALVTRPGWFFILLVGSGLYVWLYCGFELNRPGAFPQKSSRNMLKLLSYNMGQNGRTSLKPFLNATNPDVLVLQDAGKRGVQYARDPAYGEWEHMVQEGEFVILSRFPVVSQKTITGTFPKKQGLSTIALAAKFVVDWKGVNTSVYAVHLPTPRDVLQWYSRRGTFLYGIFGISGTPLAGRKREYQAYWDARIRIGELLSVEMGKDSNPKLVAGDLNVPPHGVVYHKLGRDMQDTHKVAGSGFGFTFPGDTRNPAALFRPWLRLDYILADDHWMVSSFTTERGRKSQHRAICAALILKAFPSP